MEGGTPIEPDDFGSWRGEGSDWESPLRYILEGTVVTLSK